MARIARALFLRAARTLPVGALTVELPDGSTAVKGGPGSPTLTVHREDFFHRLGAHGRIGFGEAYMAGDWSADDLPGALAAFAASLDRLALDDGPGGDGRHRGGKGIVLEYRVRSNGCFLTCAYTRNNRPNRLKSLM